MVKWPHVAAGAGGVLALGAAAAYKYPWVKHDIHYIRAMIKAFKTVSNLEKHGMFMIDIFEEKCRQFPQKPFIIFEDKIFTYEYVNEMANKAAHALLDLGITRGDTIALCMVNSPEFIWIELGAMKLGVVVALINHYQRSKSLVHSCNISSPRILIISSDEQLVEAVSSIQDSLGNTRLFVQGSASDLPSGIASWDSHFEVAHATPISKTTRAGMKFTDTGLYIYTSGTTGLPKAAIITQNRLLRGSSLGLMNNLNSDDIFYTPLPLYHSAAGVIGIGGTIAAGATCVLRAKFSASGFWEDCRRHGVTVIQYIGELCRYLLANPPKADDRKHKIRLALGNGLRKDVFEEFQARFKIPVISEFYAATEGNIAFVNLFNKAGVIGRFSPIIQKLTKSTLVKCDPDIAEPIRNKQGYCVPVKPGQPGLLISTINEMQSFEGYKGNEEATSAKIIRDAFSKGDKWCNSGDLLTVDKDYFVYFSDRVGDTFRWKGENVSTLEVSTALCSLPNVFEANVYGVQIPGKDGRAGMASLTMTDHISTLSTEQLCQIFEHCFTHLPRYAVPLFIRVQKKLEVTSTFKLIKGNLVKEGFDPYVIADSLYCVDFQNKSYVPLTKDLYKHLVSDQSRL